MSLLPLPGVLLHSVRMMRESNRSGAKGKVSWGAAGKTFPLLIRTLMRGGAGLSMERGTRDEGRKVPNSVMPPGVEHFHVASADATFESAVLALLRRAR